MESHFQPYVAVWLVARRGGELLLMRRFKTGWMDGMYTLPAGHIDGGETVQAAMAREAKEEIGITIAPENLSIVHVMHRKSTDREYFDFYLEAREWKGEPSNTEPEKCDDVQWFLASELPENVLENAKAALAHIEKGEKFSTFGF